MEERFVAVPGGEIYTVSLGSGPQTLLIIHGGPDWDHSYLLPPARALALERRVILFDLRGCGRSSRFARPEAYGIPQVVADIEAILPAYRLSACHVLGFSFGGRIALELWRHQPELVQSLILASTTAYDDYRPDLDNWSAYQARFTPEMAAFQQHAFRKAPAAGPEPSRSLALQTLPLDIFDPAHLPAARNLIEQIQFSSEWIKAFRAGALAREPLEPEILFAADSPPLLIIHGAGDMRFPVSVARRLHAAVAGSQLVVLPEAGHLAYLEAAEPWTAAINQFLASQA